MTRILALSSLLLAACGASSSPAGFVACIAPATEAWLTATK
jgi:hypothetical protein